MYLLDCWGDVHNLNLYVDRPSTIFLMFALISISLRFFILFFLFLRRKTSGNAVFEYWYSKKIISSFNSLILKTNHNWNKLCRYHIWIFIVVRYCHSINLRWAKTSLPWEELGKDDMVQTMYVLYVNIKDLVS